MIDRDVVCFSSVDWTYLWQVHQEVTSRFAAGGTRVLYIESTGLRAPRLADAARLGRRVQNASTTPRTRVPPGLTVHSPVVLPFPYSRLARRVNRRLLQPVIERWIGDRPPPIALIFLPTPLTLELAAALRPALTIYYCVDDLPRSSAAARAVARAEARLLRDADLVFVTSDRLRTKALQYRKEAHFFPAGVDFERFAAAAELPSDLRDIPRPIAGYAGGQPPWLDTALLRETAQLIPDVQFVLVGPLDVPALASLPNVHVLGPRAHESLSSYLHAFDIGLIPYVRSAYTDAIYPAKLNEYLAAGLPVVSTAMHEMTRLRDQFGDVVHLADGPQAFATAVRAALASRSDTQKREARLSVARANDWTTRLAAMASLINAQLR